jgi:hypothetical protein
MSHIEVKVAQGSDELRARVTSFERGLEIGTIDLDYTHPCKSVFILG